MTSNGNTYKSTQARSNGGTSRPSVRPSGAKKRTGSSSPSKASRSASASSRAASKQAAKTSSARSGVRSKAASSARSGKPQGSSVARKPKRNAQKSKAPSRSKQQARNQRAAASANAGAVGEKALEIAGSGVQRVLSNRIATVVAIVLIVLVVGGVWDTASNLGKAYGNVRVNGIDVGGMTAEQIDETLRTSLGQRVAQTQVKVYANQDAKRIESGNMTDEERLAQMEREAVAEEVGADEAAAVVTSWPTDAQSLKATVPYEKLAESALAVGREDGGIFSRLGLFFAPHDVDVRLNFDAAALDALASEVDRSVGDMRVDATVAIEEGQATPVAGHDGMMVDRNWFAGKISDALISGEESPSFVAEVSSAPSRITFEQAQATSDCINHALQVGAVFTYQGKDWTAYGYSIGQWTRVSTVEADGGYKLDVHIDQGVAIPAVITGAGAVVKSDNVTVKFAKGDNGIVVRTFGPGNIPEVAPAVEQLDEALYGKDGIAWNASAIQAPRIEIDESDAPAALTLEQAIDTGIVSVIGEYTTDFSNDIGTENRNHNIKLAADILNNTIIEANGGTWSFNDRAGDTNEAAGFWAAGSIVEGEYVDSIGGGICQIATTIFNAVYEAGLPITMRFPHTLYISSYPTGRDAAVSYPDLDLRWKNDLSSDVLLAMSYTDTSVTARLYSVHTGYTVTSEVGTWQDGARYQTIFKEDPSLASGESYVETVGVDGSFITVTRIVKREDGSIVSDQPFESKYDPKDEVIVVGPGTDTKKLGRAEDSQSTIDARREMQAYGDD